MSAQEEDELESYLQRRALLRVHRSYQEQLEPPPELDQIVLRKARLAIQSRQRTPAPLPASVTGAYIHHQRRRWYAPASVAATVLVCLTLLVDLGAHALHSGPPASVQLHEETSESVAAQAAGPVLAKVDDEPSPAVVYTGAPIFEVVIRTARLSARPLTDSPRSAGSASR